MTALTREHPLAPSASTGQRRVSSLETLGAAPRRDLDELESFGFALERHPYQGVAYRGPSARLCPDQIEYELGTQRIGRRIAVWNRVTSTNDLAARGRFAANEGLVILAESQTAGRGSRGRRWTAPAGTSLLMSVLLFPPEPLTDPAWLTGRRGRGRGNRRRMERGQRLDQMAE